MSKQGKTAQLYIYWQDLWLADKQQALCWHLSSPQGSQVGTDSLSVLQSKFPLADLILVLSAEQVRYHHVAMNNVSRRQQHKARRYLLQNQTDATKEQLYIHWHQDQDGQTALFADRQGWQATLATFAAMSWPLSKVLVDAQLLPNEAQWVGLKWSKGAIFRQHQQVLALQDNLLLAPDTAKIGVAMQTGRWLLPQVSVSNSHWANWADIEVASSATDEWLFSQLIAQHDTHASINMLATNSPTFADMFRLKPKWLVIASSFLMLAFISLVVGAWQWHDRLQTISQLDQHTAAWQTHYFPNMTFSSSPTRDLQVLLDKVPDHPQWPQLLYSLDLFQQHFVSPYKRLTDKMPSLTRLTWEAEQLQLQVQIEQTSQVEALLANLGNQTIPMTWQYLDDRQIILFVSPSRRQIP